MAGAEIFDFDGVALFEALNATRSARQLSWSDVADEIWRMSVVLNRARIDHPIAPSTLINVDRRGNTSCQHALFMLRWLGRVPEDFLRGLANTQGWTACHPPVLIGAFDGTSRSSTKRSTPNDASTTRRDSRSLACSDVRRVS